MNHDVRKAIFLSGTGHKIKRNRWRENFRNLTADKFVLATPIMAHCPNGLLLFIIFYYLLGIKMSNEMIQCGN